MFAEGPPDETPSTEEGDLSTLQWLGVATAVLLLLGLAIVFFTVPVCDRQLAQNSSAVRVCRHMQITDPPAAAMGIAALALLASTVFGEISGFGITLKQRVKEVESLGLDLKRMQQRTEATLSQTREAALRALENSEDLYDAKPIAMTPPGVPAEVDQHLHTALDGLVEKYNHIRRTMPSGTERTLAMESVTQQMASTLADSTDFDVGAFLASPDRGERLAAYTYLLGHPTKELAPRLVERALQEDKPFGEFRGELALERLFNTYPDAFTPEYAETVRQRLGQLSPNSDRGRALRRILELAEPHP